MRIKKNKSTTVSLPEDIITDILSMLPIKSISRFRCVCKPWYDLFKNPKFIKMHLHHANENNKFSILLGSDTGSGRNYEVYYTIDFDVTSSSHHMVVRTALPPDTYVCNDLLIDLCDGLIGLSADTDPSWNTLLKICLWNPLTREYKKISVPTLSNNNKWDVFSRYGVCYDWRIDDYKLFRTVVKDNACTEVWVCRLDSNSWEKIGDMPYDIYPYGFTDFWLPLKPLNGIIHWIGKNKVIISFDIVEELIKEINIPSCFLDDELYSSYLMEVGVVGEDLYLSVHPRFRMGNIQLWLMKDYGVIDSWTQIFSFSVEEINFDVLRPLHYLNKNSKILLHGVVGVKYDDEDWDAEDSIEDALVSYDLIDGSLVTLDIPNMPKKFSPTIFVGSLVSLNSGELVEATKNI